MPSFGRSFPLTMDWRRSLASDPARKLPGRTSQNLHTDVNAHFFLSSEINFRRSITNATEQVTEPRVFAQPLEAGLHIEPHQLSGALPVSGLEQVERLLIITQGQVDEREEVRR